MPCIKSFFGVSAINVVLLCTVILAYKKGLMSISFIHQLPYLNLNRLQIQSVKMFPDKMSCYPLVFLYFVSKHSLLNLSLEKFPVHFNICDCASNFLATKAVCTTRVAASFFNVQPSDFALYSRSDTYMNHDIK